MWDVHCHLAASDFHEDRTLVLKSAAASNVTDVVVVPENYEESVFVLENYREWGAQGGVRLHPCVGIHPCSVSELVLGSLNQDGVGDRQEEMHSCKERIAAECQKIRDLALLHRAEVVGVGEVGLDYTPRVMGGKEGPLCEFVKEMQLMVLDDMVALAKELSVPLNMHSRNAGHHAINFLVEKSAPPSLFHAFDGRPHYAEQGAKSGHFFSIPPSVARSKQKNKLIERLDINSLLLETDSPALGPVVNERNVPENLVVSLNAIAESKGLSPNDVLNITKKNSEALFHAM